MNFKKHSIGSIQATIDTFSHKENYVDLDFNRGRVYIVGSGSSYSQAIFLSQLFFDKLKIPSVFTTPYSFVKYSNFTQKDVCIHFSQEGKRNDNVCPLTFAKKQGGRTVLFTSKKDSKAAAYADHVYWYAPEFDKILVASMSYLSGYAAAINYINFLLGLRNLPKIDTDVDRLKEKMNGAFSKKLVFQDTFTVAMYTNEYSKSVAVENALKINECLLVDSESYGMKHYSHGKHFVSYNHDRLYNIFCSNQDDELLKLYQNTIFENHHNINILKSDLPKEVAVFEWGMMMLAYIVQGMEEKGIKLEDIPIRDKIRVPHEFQY